MATTEITSHVWDIYEPPIIDSSTTEYEYIEYKEKRVNVEGLVDYEFVNSDLDFYILPSESYIQVKGRIRSTRADDNTGIFEAGDVSLVNGGCNLFDHARYDIDTSQIQQLDYAGIATQIKGLVEYQKDYENSLTNEMWAVDRSDGVTKRRNLTVTVAGAAGGFSIQAGNRLGIDAGVDNAAIIFFVDGVQINFIQKSTAGGAGSITLLRNGANDNDGVDHAGIAQKDQYEAYANGRKLQFYLRGLPAYFYADATPNIAIANGAATAAGAGGQLVVEYVDEYNSDTLNRNNGFIKRQEKLLRKVGTNPGRYDKQFNICIPIKRFFQIFEANNHVFRGIKHTIKLWKNSSIANMVFRNAATKDITDAETVAGTAVGFVTISYAAWWVPALKPSLSVGLKIDKELAAGAKKSMMWDEINCFKSNSFTANTTSATWIITSMAHKPSKVYLVCQTTARDNSQTTNNMLFDNLKIEGDANRPGIDRAQVRLGSVQYPKEEYTCNFVQGVGEDVSRIYEMYLTMHGKINDKTSGALINIDEFRELYPIFCFDLSAQDTKIWQSATPINIEARIHIGGNGAPSEFIMWAVVQYERNVVLTGVDNRMRVIL